MGRHKASFFHPFSYFIPKNLFISTPEIKQLKYIFTVFKIDKSSFVRKIPKVSFYFSLLVQ